MFSETSGQCLPCCSKELVVDSLVAMVAVAIFTTCFQGLVVRYCRSGYQVVYVWVQHRVYYSEC